MPSAKILEAKKAYVAELNTKIAGSLAGVVVAYNGISVADDTKMRKELREAGVEYMVVKNTMLRRAVAGTQYDVATDVIAVGGVAARQQCVVADDGIRGGERAAVGSAVVNGVQGGKIAVNANPSGRISGRAALAVVASVIDGINL